jgi:hypothetical protein
MMLPPTLFPRGSFADGTKYVGGFVDETSVLEPDSLLRHWVDAKTNMSMIYIAVGSISIVNEHRMQSLVEGLAEFLLQERVSSVLLAFRYANYDNYHRIVSTLVEQRYRHVLQDQTRVRIERRFIPQKWILRHHALHVFVSHCGMGSTVETIHFEKSLLCLPLCTDQFSNAIAVQRAGVGESLFEPPGMLESLRQPLHFHTYTFTANEVIDRLRRLWHSDTHRRAIRLISMEMKRAGGVRGAVQDIEIFVEADGDLQRETPFEHRLAFYQRYLLDVLFVVFLLPLFGIVSLCRRCRRSRVSKEKRE